VRVGKRRSRAAVVTAKATEGVKTLDCSPDEPPGVWGSERSEGDDGNWGDPPRPGGPDGSGALGTSRPITGAQPGSGCRAGRVSEAAVVPLEPTGQQNPR